MTPANLQPAQPKRQLVAILILVALTVGVLTVVYFQGGSTDDKPPLSPREQAKLELHRLEQEYAGARGEPETLAVFVEAVHRLVEQHPKFAAGRALLAKVLIDTDQPRLALEQLTVSLDLDANQPELRCLAGNVAENLDQLDVAAKHYSQAIGLDPRNGRYRLHLANVRLRRHGFDEAKTLLLEALAVDSSLHEAHAALSDIYARQNKLSLALDQIRKALEVLQRAPTTDYDTRVAYSLKRARLQRRDGRPTAALTQLRQLGPKATVDLKVLEEMAICLANPGRFVEAAQIYELPLVRFPLEWRYRAKAAHWRLRAGDLEAFHRHLHILRQVDPDLPIIAELERELELKKSLAESVGFSADWPQWRGPNRDGKSLETKLREQWPAEGLEPVWVAEGLGQGYSTVAVAGGVIYATGMVGEEHQGVLFAFDLAGGRKWQTPYGPEWHGTYPGARSTPTVDGERIYVMTGLGRVVCFEARTGKIEWSQHVAVLFGGKAPLMGFAESVLVYGDKVICTPGGKDASVVGLEKTSGRTLWTSRGFSEQSAYCSPILIERGGQHLVVTITAKHVVGLNPETGALVWQQPQDAEAKDQNHSVSPVYQGGFIYATSGHGEGGQLLELSPDGQRVKQKWVDRALNCLHGGVVIVDGYIYGSNGRGQWICLDVDSGEVMYEAGGVGRGSVAYADGMLYCYGQNGKLALVPASPKGYEPVGRGKVTHGNGQHWAHPVIAGGRLYIRHGDALMAYDISAPVDGATADPPPP